MSKENYKNKLVNLKDRVRKLEKELEELYVKLDMINSAKKDLSNKFERLTEEVRKHAEIHNVVLSRKLEAEMEQMEQKESQLQQLL